MTAPTRIIRPNALATDQAVQADNAAVFTTSLIDRIKVKATANPKGTPNIRPIKIKGRDKYVMFLHPYQVYQLRASAATAGSWADIQKAAMQGGQISDNPIYTGAIGEWNGVILHEANRIPNGVYSTSGAPQTSTGRAVFCGAQAGALAFGQGYAPLAGILAMAFWVGMLSQRVKTLERDVEALEDATGTIRDRLTKIETRFDGAAGGISSIKRSLGASNAS